MGFDLTNTSGELVEYTGDIPPGHSADCYGNGPFIGVVSCFFLNYQKVNHACMLFLMCQHNMSYTWTGICGCKGIAV